MPKAVTYGKTERMSFARHEEIQSMPNLLEIQKNSYKWFLEEGLRDVFKDVDVITDYSGNLELRFVDYSMDENPKYTEEECKARDATYAAPLKVSVRLRNKETEEIKEQEIFMGDFPIMTPSGTFVINGAERVIVSQIVRSPGVYYDKKTDKAYNSTYGTTVIPYHGAWLEYETDLNDIFNCRIDKNRKLPVTWFIKAMGAYKADNPNTWLSCIPDMTTGVVTNEQIKEVFDNDARIVATLDKDTCNSREEALVEIYRKLRPGDPPTVESSETLLEGLFYDCRRYDISNVGRYKFNKKLGLRGRIAGFALAAPVADPMTGEIIAEAGEVLTRERAEEIAEAGVNDVYLDVDGKSVRVFGNGMVDMKHYVDFDPAELGIKELVRGVILRQLMEQYEGDALKEAIEENLDLLIPKHIIADDMFASINYLCCLAHGIGEPDDIDHLGNRRVRSVGELLQNQFRIGFSRMERVIRERMTLQDLDVVTPQSLINIRPVTASIKEFFGSSPLSQFMDQTNPLAEITHKRRMSALGPGGLSRERAGFEVRDVHYTHYGRLCPIETPEGPNIGLISSLCVFAKINELGFIETPYRKVAEGKVDLSDEGLVYLTAEEEEAKIIAQGNAPLNDDGTFVRDKVKSRQDADYPVVPPSEVELMDVSPQQIASIAASLIPFLEHDDANRALMGSNMMRQAVPLLKSEAPIVGTGIERQLARDSRTQITAEGDGVVEFVDATTIRILYDRTEEEEFVSFEPALKEYNIPKWRRTNQNMTIDLRPICEKGQRVTAGQILTEGYSTEDGELALGKNLLVAYMPWKGYNYEDAIVLNERVVREDLLTSVHVEEYSLEVRETKRGMEELTSDIPNVSEEATKDLDENGIVRVGARIEPGDILIGKITPKGESDPSPEEKLLRAIFGDKAGDVKDASLKASPSLKGVVIGKRLFSRVVKTRSSKLADKALLPKIDDEFDAKIGDLKKVLINKLLKLTENYTSEGVKDYMGADIISKGARFSASDFSDLDFTAVQLSNWTKDEHTNGLIRALVMNFIKKYKELDAELKRKKFAITIGDELPAGIIQMAKVYIAKKRKIGVGDKMAGRHGNKGIVSRVVRQEDMPFLADGTPVDIVLNPLGVPSRMNIGQIFEAVLGRAGKNLGVKFATPIFDGASLDDLNEWTDKAGLPRYGKTTLYDGGTGEAFEQQATVGVTYMLKLGHMVEDKMHARSIGPYSLITQQPFGGKAQFGGQRFGEMEVWALEAFGAAHILQEILTIKSDDVVGRSKAYEAIVKGEPMPAPGIPESLNVLLHELRGLGLSINLE